jgi:hypothetical protein
MKTTYKIVLTALVLSGVQFVLAGCVADVGVEGGYRGGGPWYHDGGWMDGGRWGGPRGGVGIDLHPPGFRR